MDLHGLQMFKISGYSFILVHLYLKSRSASIAVTDQTSHLAYAFCVTLITDYIKIYIKQFCILQSQHIRNINPMRHVWLLFFTSLYAKRR